MAIVSSFLLGVLGAIIFLGTLGWLIFALIAAIFGGLGSFFKP